MKQLKENEGIERGLLLTMAVIAGLTVANCYYNQPLLEMIRHDMGVSQHEANLITVVTQIGYALGLCFLIPMGDLYSRRRIIVVNMTVAAIMAVVIAVASKVWMIWGASLLLGACSVIPQFFIPIAGQYSKRRTKAGIWAWFCRDCLRAFLPREWLAVMLANGLAGAKCSS